MGRLVILSGPSCVGKGPLHKSLKDLENIEVRAGSAYKEMKEAWRFDFVIPNHDDEDSDNWNASYYPIGDARNALTCFAEILSAVGFADVETSPAVLR
jgi:guanylate kinase